MPRCCIKRCPTQAGGLHRFPKNDKVRQQWIAFCDNGRGWVPGPNSRQVLFLLQTCYTICFEPLKRLSYEMDLAFDGMYLWLVLDLNRRRRHF
jgi:hypothetical protein